MIIVSSNSIYVIIKFPRINHISICKGNGNIISFFQISKKGINIGSRVE